MGAEARIIGGVVAGYLLGRGKKMKLALSLAGMLAGKQISTDPKVIAKQVAELADTNPRLADLKGEVTGELLQAAQAAATAILTQRMNTLSDTLRDRSDSLRGLAEEAEEIEGEVVPEDDGGESESGLGAEEEIPAEGEEEAPLPEEYEEKTAPAKKSAPAKKTASGQSSARRTASKQAPAKKSTAKKSTAKKSAPAKKTASKQSSAKKAGSKQAPAKKSTAKKSAPRKKTASRSQSGSTSSSGDGRRRSSAKAS